jgi:hypothetical protein
MIFHNIFTPAEIKNLLDYFEKQPTAHVEKVNNQNRCYNKNLDYQISGSVCHSIVRAKIDNIIGTDHSINMGCYKESHVPYALHFDDNQTHYKKNVTQLNSENRYNCAVLIPLVESSAFKTVSFDIRYKEDQSIVEALQGNQTGVLNGLNLEDFDHFSQESIQYVPQLPVFEVFSWKIGDVFVWERDIMHCSTNFQKHGLVKKFIIMFIA